MDNPRFKGVLAILEEPGADKRIIRYPRGGGLRHRELPLPLRLRRLETGAVGNPVETFYLAGHIDALFLRGNELVCEGELDRGEPAGQALIQWLSKPKTTAALAIDLGDITLAIDTMLNVHAPPDILQWTVIGASAVPDEFASWPQARMVLIR